MIYFLFLFMYDYIRVFVRVFFHILEDFHIQKFQKRCNNSCLGKQCGPWAFFFQLLRKEFLLSAHSPDKLFLIKCIYKDKNNPHILAFIWWPTCSFSPLGHLSHSCDLLLTVIVHRGFAVLKFWTFLVSLEPLNQF